MKQDKNPLISFLVKVDEMLKFKSHAEDNSAFSCKDIFRVENAYYMFTYNRSSDVHTNTLREITKEEFYIKKAEMLSYRPQKHLQIWRDNANSYELRSYARVGKKWQIRANDCLFITEENPLKKIYEQVMDSTTELLEQSKEKELLKKKQYAKLCGTLSLKMDIAYENVIRIGPNREKLIQFKESVLPAMMKIQKMTLSELRLCYNNLSCLNGRSGREQAAEMLGLKYFGADVKMLNLRELEEPMQKKLDAYVLLSLKMAVHRSAALSYEDRKEMYQNIISASREKRKKVLGDLGIEVLAIDINRYPFAALKKNLAATIGINLERYR
ncbi:MAG: hypothetical protein J6B00_01645 [Alphaproteobacteria bacterium]|nr:hypothetical protein [Alphaproteobacteria bacterium]